MTSFQSVLSSLHLGGTAMGVTMTGRPGASDAFWFTAVSYWLDMQTIIRSEYEAALQRLPLVSPIDRDLLAERAQNIDRHLARVAEKLPATADALLPATDASDAVVLHLWQATRVFEAARSGPADLRALLAAVRDRL